MRRVEFLVLALLGVMLAGCATMGTVSSVDQVLKRPGIQLLDLKGQDVDLRPLIAKHQATVLVWWGSTCPCVGRYKQRVDQLRKKYSARQVAILLVASNADDDLKSIRKHAGAKGLGLPLIRDLGGRLARRMGVVSTPTTVLLDRQGQIRFIGWLDNERKPGVSGRVAWLENALTSVLKNSSVSTTRTPVYGCLVTRSLSTTSPKGKRTKKSKTSCSKMCRQP